MLTRSARFLVTIFNRLEMPDDSSRRAINESFLLKVLSYIDPNIPHSSLNCVFIMKMFIHILEKREIQDMNDEETSSDEESMSESSEDEEQKPNDRNMFSLKIKLEPEGKSKTISV